MNTAQLLQQVNHDADARQYEVILNALDNLSSAFEQVKEELQEIELAKPNLTSWEIEQCYEAVLKKYTNTRIMLHHVYKWLRDGKDYIDQDTTIKSKERSLRTRYLNLWDQAEDLRLQKNKLLSEIDPEAAQKKLVRGKPSHRIKPLYFISS